MDIFSSLKKLLNEKNILKFGAVPFSSCKTVRPYKLGEDISRMKTVYIFAVPYLCRTGKKNISAYAVAKDYHLFFKKIFDEILPFLHNNCPEYKFYGFADSSPVSEVNAAALAGIGIIGDNGLLITEEYSSFVFLGEIITDYPERHFTEQQIRRCPSCGKCKLACPVNEGCGACLSEVTQRKGELDASDKAFLLKYNTVWGCDICQTVCPYTAAAIKNGTIYSPIPFFNENLTPFLTYGMIENMPDDEFKERAYSWRKKEVLLRNLKIYEEGNSNIHSERRSND